MLQVKSFKEYLTGRYGRPLSRIAFDLGLGCPNRQDGFGEGCSFCAADGARARHLSRRPELAQQAACGIEYVRRRYGAEAPYIAYFQSFTNTFAPVERLRALYGEALAQADFRVVIVSTRPDALPEDVVDFLAELGERYELWVELGVQSACDATLARVRRGHDFAATQDAVRRLAARGIRTAAHLILGLPGEGPDEWRATAHAVGALPFQAVKLHQLMVLRHTPLAAEYRREPFPTLNEYEYARAAKLVLRELPEGMLLMRLSGDAPEETLIAPRWWMDKGRFLEFFQANWREEGDAVFPGVETADGSRTLYHPEFRQHFHSLAGAEGEARHKFVEAARLKERLERAACVRILDIGFGLGGNAFAALNCAGEAGGGRALVTAFELDDRVVRAAVEVASSCDRARLETLRDSSRLEEASGRVELRYGDARKLIRECDAGAFDLVFLDAFSPEVNPELWSLHFLREVRRVLACDGVLATYSGAAPVRGALLKLGFAVGESTPFGRRRSGTVAALRPDGIASPLSDKERAIVLRSTAGAPYMDRTLAAERSAILAHHAALVGRLRARGVPKWAKWPENPAS